MLLVELASLEGGWDEERRGGGVVRRKGVSADTGGGGHTHTHSFAQDEVSTNLPEQCKVFEELDFSYKKVMQQAVASLGMSAV